MAESYTFTHNGITVHYFPSVVKTQLEKRRLLRKLMEAYGYLGSEPVPDDVWDDFGEFCGAISQCKADASWWVSSNAAPEQVREAFENFMSQDTDLFSELVTANTAVLPPKKTMTRTSTT
jgi:hypothetical protein